MPPMPPRARTNSRRCCPERLCALMRLGRRGKSRINAPLRTQSRMCSSHDLYQVGRRMMKAAGLNVLVSLCARIPCNDDQVSSDKD